MKINEREDPRVLRTRHLLLQAFSDLYAEKGFNDMTVQDITDRAGVNRGTFYSHFEDRYALMEIWLREEFQQRIAGPVLSAGPWSLSTFRLLVQYIVEWFTQMHQTARSDEQSLIPLVVTTLQEALFELLWHGFKSVASSERDQQSDLETIAMVTSWAIFGAGFQCFRQRDEPTIIVSPEELAVRVTRVLMSGIAQALPAFPLK